MHFKADEVNVVYCSSDLFSEVCAVSMVSLFENNRHLQDIHVFVIDDHISEKNKDRMMAMTRQYGRQLTFIPLPDPAVFYGDERFTIGSLGHTYARMILGDVIPEAVERIISLDSDTMVLGNVDALWNIDMGAYPIAGVDDCMGKVALVKTQHLKEDAVHCNAGMFLINLNAWREEKWTEQFFVYIKRLFDKGIALGGYEEEVINKILGERMMVLHPKFNLMTLEQVLTYQELLCFREPIHYYTEEEIKEAIKDPVITHTTNFFYIKKRIFEEYSDHPMRKQYEKYRLLTPWCKDPPMASNPNFKQKMMKDVWHSMPRRLSLRVANFVRNEIRPLLRKKRDDE